MVGGPGATRPVKDWIYLDYDRAKQFGGIVKFMEAASVENNKSAFALSFSVR